MFLPTLAVFKKALSYSFEKNITQKYISFKQVILSYKERLFVYYSNYMPQKENLLFAAGSDLDHYSSN